MALLVTGCAGFIGSNLCLSLLKKGKKVIGLDNLDPYYPRRIKKRNLDELNAFQNFKFYQKSITDNKSLEKIFRKHKIEKIINLAAKAGVRASFQGPESYIKTNVIGTLNLLEMAKKYKAKQFIQASTSSIYGLSKKLPYKETDPANTPLAPYPATKKAAEMLCHSYAYNFQIPTTILRFFTVYGEKGRPDMAVYKFTDLISQGKKIQVYGNEKAIDRKFAFEIINLGKNRTVELMNPISLIEKELGKKAKIEWKKSQMGDMEQTYADVAKAKRLLGWKPHTHLEKGIKKFVKWFRNNGVKVN